MCGATPQHYGTVVRSTSSTGVIPRAALRRPSARIFTIRPGRRVRSRPPTSAPVRGRRSPLAWARSRRCRSCRGIPRPRRPRIPRGPQRTASLPICRSPKPPISHPTVRPRDTDVRKEGARRPSRTIVFRVRGPAVGLPVRRRSAGASRRAFKCRPRLGWGGVESGARGERFDPRPGRA